MTMSTEEIARELQIEFINAGLGSWARVGSELHNGGYSTILVCPDSSDADEHEGKTCFSLIIDPEFRDEFLENLLNVAKTLPSGAELLNLGQWVQRHRWKGVTEESNSEATEVPLTMQEYHENRKGSFTWKIPVPLSTPMDAMFLTCSQAWCEDPKAHWEVKRAQYDIAFQALNAGEIGESSVAWGYTPALGGLTLMTPRNGMWTLGLVQNIDELELLTVGLLRILDSAARRWWRSATSACELFGDQGASSESDRMRRGLARATALGSVLNSVLQTWRTRS